jgi:hypothetical protein
MREENLARLRTHRNNMLRYRRLLATQLSDADRAYMTRRLEEEQAAAEVFLQNTFPASLPAAVNQRMQRRKESPRVRA